MNNFTRLNLKEVTFHNINGAFFLLIFLLISSVSFGQTTLLNETFGTTATLPTGWTSSNTTNGWSGNTSSASSTYIGFSAGTNALFAATGTNGATHTLTYNNSLSTVGFTGITVLWGARGTATFSGSVPFEWSSDGTNWNAVTYTQVTYNASWALVNSGVRIALPAGTAGVTNLRFRWTGTSTNNGNFRIDDFTVQGSSGTTITSNAVTGNWSSGSSWVGGVAPISSDNVVIVSGATITMDTTAGGINTRNSNTTTTVNSGGTLATSVTYTNNGTTTINGTFQLNSGGWATGTNNLVYGSAGTLIFNATYGANNGNYWPTANGPFNVTVNSGCPLDLGFARTVAGLFQTSANINNPGNITANGTLQLNSGYGWSGTGNPIYGASSLLKYNSGGSPGRAAEWTATSGTIGTTAGYPNNVQVSNSTTLNFANGGTGTYKANGTLTVDSGSSLYQNFSGGNAGLSVVSDITINGNITLGTASGDLYVGGNLTVGASANFSTAGRAVFFNGTGTQTITKTGTGTVAFDYFIVDKTAGSVVLNSSPATEVTVNASSGNVLQLNNTGSLDLNGRSMTFNNAGGGIYVNGARTINSTIVGGNLTFTNYKFVANNAGTGSLTLAANVTVNLNTNGNLDFGKSGATYITTLIGTLSINSTTSCFVNTNPPIYGAAALLKYNSGGIYGRGLEWSTTSGAGYPNDVQVTNSTTLDFPNTGGTFTTNLALARNLTIDSASALYMDYGAGAASGSLTIGGNLSNAGNLSLGDALGGDLSLVGNWSNSGTFNANNRLVTFTGATPTLNGTTTFAFLTLNCSTGLTLQTSSPVTVNQTLTFTNGKLTIGANNLTIGTSGSISGADTAKYIVAASTGQLKRTVGASATLFPVGNTAYNPITFNNSGTSDVYGVRVANSAPAGANNTKTITRQWITTEAVAGGSNLSVAAQYNTGENGSGFNTATDTFIGHYNGTAYSQQVAATHAGTNPFTVTSNANLTPSDLTTGTQYFAIGRDNGLISVPFKYVVTAITPTSPTAGSGFSATITAQDAYAANTILSSSSTFNLTSNGNAGAISGTTTGTINSGSSSVVVSGIILANAGTLVTLTATNASGLSVAPGTSATFTVLAAASQLAFVGVPTSGNVGVNLTSFTVEARRPDNSVDNTYVSNITIAKTSGTGALVGTLTVTPVAGVATYSAAQFDTASTYTITATSGSLTSPVSGNIVVTLAPTVIAQFDFTTNPYINYTAKNSNVGVTDFAISSGTLSTLVTTGSEFPNEPYVAGNGGGWTTTTQAGAKNFNFTVTANAGYVIEVTSLQFNALATAAGPSAFSYDIAGGTAIYTTNAPDTALVAVNQNTTGLTNLSTVPFLIQGWLNNSRTSSGAGNFRIDDVIVKGYVTCKTPTTFTVGGGGAYCSGGTGMNVTLSGSEGNINYQLKLNGNNQGSPIAGTGNALNFGLQTGAGNYTVVATNTNGTCNVSQAMTGSVAITIDAVSVGGSVTGGITVCSGSTSGLLTLSGHTGSVVRWESTVSPFTTWTPITNTVATFTSNALTETTQFRAVVKSGSCTEAFSSATTVTVDALSVGGSVTGSTAVCSGSTSGLLTLSGHTGSVVRWESAVSPFTTWTPITNTTATYTSDALTETTQFRAVVQNGSCAEAFSSPITIAVDATSVGGSVAGNTVVCSGSTSGLLTLSDQVGSVVRWESSVSPFATWTNITNTATTYTSSALTQTTQFRAVVQSGTCLEAFSSPITIAVDATSVGGSVTGNTAVCSGSTSGLLALSDQVGSVVRWESAVNPFTTWTPIANTNNSYTSGTLTETTQFRAIVQNGSCSEAASTPITVTIATTTWSSTNGGEWDNGLPTATTTAVITHDYTTSVSFSACVLTVNNNAHVIVSPNHTITLNGAINVVTGSTFTLESSAVLLQGGTTNANTGAVTVKRNSSPLYRLDYTLWTSPVASQNLFGFSTQTLTNRFYTYKESTNVYSILDMYTNSLALSSSSTFQTGRGYLIRTPNNWVDVSTGTPVSYPGSFTGIPNSGDITIPIDKTAGDPDAYGYNAVGNPYPSPISITTFLGDNSGLIGSTLWFWRKLNNINQTLPGQSTTSYVTYSGGTFSSGAENYYNIEPGQGFFVKANTAGSLQFKNTQREANNGRFFRTNTQTNSVGEGRLWLYLKNNDVEVGNLAIGYKEGATNDLDEAFDGAYINDSPLALTSLVQSKELSVQHRAAPFADTDVVPLSFKTDIAGTFSIVFNNADGELSTQNVYLEDLLLGQTVDIKAAPYSFSSSTGVFGDRFRIVYLNNALGITSPTFNADQIVIYKNGQNELVINSGSTIMSTVKIFDIKGRLITERKGINASETAMNVSLNNEVLLVQITSQEGIRVTKKVVK